MIPLLATLRSETPDGIESTEEVVIVQVIPTLNGYGSDAVVVSGSGLIRMVALPTDRLQVVRSMNGFRPKGEIFVGD